MNIKKRFMTSYLSAIVISLLSVFFIVSLVLYVTIGKVPGVVDIYKILTSQRSLTKEEEEAYLAIDQLLRKSPERMNAQNNSELLSIMTEIEQSGLDVAIRKGNDFTYFSPDLVEKSLVVHSIDYELNNLKPVGTLDNAGRLYHYLKKDFQYLDGTNGSFIILKRESTLLEFFTRWGIWVVLLIICLAILITVYINRRLVKTTIEPIEKLQQATQTVENSQDFQKIGTNFPQEGITQEVYDLQKSFKDMWHKLGESEKLRLEYGNNRKDLIANISHDLKTPITSIIGYVEGLQDGVANTEEKKEKYLRVIHQKAISLNQLIEELFLYSKLELEEQNFSLERVGYNVFVKEFYDYYMTTHPDINWYFEDNSHSEKVMIDIIQMERVLTNIVENCLKFEDLEKEKLEIKVLLYSKKNSIYLSIKDNGIGISEEDLSFVFERFYRVDKSRTPSVKGSGLGLSIVNQIMIKQDGDVTIKSTQNQGTEIVLTLPIAHELEGD